MKLLLDTANIEKIEEYIKYLPVDGVTTNPSILKKEGNIELASHIKQVRKIIGVEKSLHVQTVASDYAGMIKDAHKILNLIDENVFVKIPSTKDGLAAIKTLKQEGVNITATAIYTEIQARLAKELGANYLAPYVNRMSNLNINPYEVISNMSNDIKDTNSSTRILGASFKNIQQVLDAVNAGSTHVTVGEDVLDLFLQHENINIAVKDFGNDWFDIHNNYEI